MVRIKFICLLLSLCFVATGRAVTNHWSDGISSGKPPRIYVTGNGVHDIVSLSDIKASLPKAPLEQVAPGIWHLRAELIVENGAKLVLYGTKIGGDVNQLRLQSNNHGDPIHDIVFIRADWGTLDIRSTSITSWDDDINGPDAQQMFHRAYIVIRSTLDEDGVTPHESRMDIQDSDIGYLGTHDAEAYGLVWKVLEAKDPRNRPYGALTNLYSLVNVYGNILRSHIHHNFFGMYSFGAYGMQMQDNEFDHNVGYGFDPHDDSDYLVIERNNVHHNGWHGIIASQRCNNAIIRNNISWANGRCGIMLHRYCDDSIIEGNHSYNNGDAGIALFDNYRTIVRSNTCLGNFTAGIRLSVGPADNLIVDNEFGEGRSFGLYLYEGVDAPFPGDNGHPKRNTFLNNYVHHNAANGIFSTSADDNIFAGNIFEANGKAELLFVNGQRNHFESNSIPSTATLRLQGSQSVLASAFIKNQPALSIQVDPYSIVTFQDPACKIFDPAEAGIATTVTTNGSSLTLTTVEVARDNIAKLSFVQTRNFQATPDAGTALVTVTVWNTTGDFSKRWLTQASSSTHKMTYKVSDLAPGNRYHVSKDGISNSYTADSTGTITIVDTSVTTGVTEYVVGL